MLVKIQTYLGVGSVTLFRIHAIRR